MKGQMYTEIPIVFEEVRFHRATNIPKEGKYCGAVVRSSLTQIKQFQSDTANIYVSNTISYMATYFSILIHHHQVVR
jgi:hypothetical protein